MSIDSRNVTLYCPICGNDQFIMTDIENEDVVDALDDTTIQCADCKTTFTKAELIDSNQDIINANIEEIMQDAIKDIKKEIKKVFK